MNSPDPKLRRLTDEWNDGTISAEEVLQLERRLLDDPAARRYFFAMAELEAALPLAAEKLPARDRVTAGMPFPWWRMAAVFVIGMFAGALVWKAETPGQVVESRPAPVEAKVTGMLGISWNDATDLLALPPGKETRIQSGLVEVTFSSGTRAVLEGPASFQISDGNSMRLTHGKIVAEVPKGAEGFTVSYADGQIVDIGTEFGLEIPQGGGTANFGVFRGEIEYRPEGDARRMVRLLENHAVITEGGTITSVPFDSSKFTRRMPSREFVWKITSSNTRQSVWEYDVSHLIWKPGSYRAIVKWMMGPGSLEIRKAELLLNGQPVAADIHDGTTRWSERTSDNSYSFVVAPEQYRRGTWVLRLDATPDTSSVNDPRAEGVILFEDGLSMPSQAADFVGTWEYMHSGIVYRRSFHPDGSASLTMDGKPYEFFKDSTWVVRDGRLILDVLHPRGNRVLEEHILRDANTLIFTNCPYRDARRIVER